MKLTVGHVRQLFLVGCILFWIVVGVLGYHLFITMSEWK